MIKQKIRVPKLVDSVRKSVGGDKENKGAKECDETEVNSSESDSEEDPILQTLIETTKDVRFNILLLIIMKTILKYNRMLNDLVVVGHTHAINWKDECIYEVGGH